ncbi:MULTISPECIES: DUF3443 domain-containing protein [unclassified Paraburkholderia]|uniref:DUF3443 domain-containing protein n=1 Tax=unclassified Paraburkholderia TaxID=2615204 RepID=UPI0019814BB3|nr:MULTISPECIES: DUF3443 domain-containing protein [unclassified Paraburkholderia]MBN3858192.1 DUF3443 domain-containing protein [Paraburkholderia sp. Ac-20340]
MGALFALATVLAACGGGGGSSGSSSASSASGDTSGLPAGPTQQPIAATSANTVAVTVNSGVTNTMPNIPTVSVTVCAAGSSTCQTVDNIQVDTGSYGLRVLNSAFTSTMRSALSTIATSSGTLAECTAFADGYTWGTVRSADVKIGGETASAIPIQVIGDLATSSVPTICSNIGAAQNTTSALGANGILGIGVAPWDCGSTCVTATSSNYFACPNGTSCTQTGVALTQQVANPVAHFTTDNNGVILQMPPVSNNGQASATGTLVFGIGTQSNNTMAASQRFTTTAWGDLTTTFNSRSLTAFLDSGSNGIFFADSAITQCGGSLGAFYCPSTALTFTTTLVDQNKDSGTISFNVVNASALLGNSSYFAFNDLAGQFGSNSSLDLGLPFFYGRYVYYGIDKTATGGTQTPYVAF